MIPELNLCHFSSTRPQPAVRTVLILSILLVLVLMACGEQNTPVVSPEATAGGGQGSKPVAGASPGQGQPVTTSASSKTPPKPGVTAANVAAGTVHICTLLTKDEAEVSVGGTNVVVDASRDSLGLYGDASCNYASGSGGLTVQVAIAGISQADFEKNNKTANAQVVPGLGDAAFFQAGLLSLSTLKGKIVLVVMLLNPAKGPETLSGATGLTRKVLAALEKTSLASYLTT